MNRLNGLASSLSDVTCFLVDEHLADLVHRVELGYVSRNMVLHVLSLTHLVLLDFFQAFLCHIEVAFVGLGCFSQIKALLSRFLILEHLVLHHGFHHVVLLIIVVDDALHVAAVLSGTRCGCERVLLRGHSVRPRLQLRFELGQVHACRAGSYIAATPTRI